MKEFKGLTEEELLVIDGGALSGFEIMIGEKVLSGAAAFGVAGVAVVALVGVAALAFYVTSKN